MHLSSLSKVRVIPINGILLKLCKPRPSLKKGEVIDVVPVPARILDTSEGLSAGASQPENESRYPLSKLPWRG
jgi:hypothetical protein